MVHDPMDLAFVADALLGLCARDPLAPFLTEEAWGDRERRAAGRERSLDANAGVELAAKVETPILAREVEEVIAAAGLTRTQGEAFDLRMRGHTFEEIGMARATSKQGAMNAFAKGLRKVAGSLARYPYQGLSDVYAAELARGSRKAAR